MTDLRAIAEAAPPGPWDWQPDDDGGNAVVYGPDGDSLAFLAYNPGNDYNMEAAAAFIVTARNTYLAALDVIEAAASLAYSIVGTDELRAALDRWEALP